jgi:hypothetical protein
MRMVQLCDMIKGKKVNRKKNAIWLKRGECGQCSPGKGWC